MRRVLVAPDAGSQPARQVFGQVGGRAGKQLQTCGQAWPNRGPAQQASVTAGSDKGPGCSQAAW